LAGTRARKVIQGSAATAPDRRPFRRKTEVRAISRGDFPHVKSRQSGSIGPRSSGNPAGGRRDGRVPPRGPQAGIVSWSRTSVRVPSTQRGVLRHRTLPAFPRFGHKTTGLGLRYRIKGRLRARPVTYRGWARLRQACSGHNGRKYRRCQWPGRGTASPGPDQPMRSRRQCGRPLGRRHQSAPLARCWAGGEGRTDSGAQHRGRVHGFEGRGTWVVYLDFAAGRSSNGLIDAVRRGPPATTATSGQAP